MNTTTTIEAKSKLRLIAWWTLGLMGTSTLLLAAVAVDLLTLNRETATLREAMFAATGVRGKMQVQMDLGAGWMQAARWTVALIPKVPDEAKLALAAARRACVGVYKVPANTRVRDGARLLVRADEEMSARGWSRTVTVTEKKQTVLIYTQDEAKNGGLLRVCIAVVDGTEMVVVSMEIAAEPLQGLVASRGGINGIELAQR